MNKKMDNIKDQIDELKKLSKELRESNKTETDGDMAADILDEVIKEVEDRKL